MYSTTAHRRQPLGAWKLDSGISARFLDSRNLWPMNFSQGNGPMWGTIVSGLHLRAMEILRNDPEVTAVTVLDW